ncbi:MAG: gephyrin-like molybdotransferase Glp [Gilvibacter sp.]
MISVEQALDIVNKHSNPSFNHELKNLEDALGSVLLKDVVSPINMPPFRQSAMDGYALALGDSDSYKIIAEVKAGDNKHPVLKKGEAVRIFTGAPVPDTANAVIMQEKVRIKDTSLLLEQSIVPDANIRAMGEQVTSGQIALEKGTPLTPAAIGFLTSLGITKVAVYKQPQIAIVVTGNELAQAGTELAYGQIYESNAIMLSSVLANLGFTNTSVHSVADDYNSTVSLLNTVINDNDVVLVSGGISVGDYDYVGKALDQLGVKELFYKVKQKPGKPLFYGKKDNKLVFALPGNPGAALTCFYVYVLLALQRLSGNLNYSAKTITARANSNFIKKGERAQFLKAHFQEGRVTILDGQNSSMLHTFALANAFVFMPEHATSIAVDQEVQVIMLPIN